MKLHRAVTLALMMAVALVLIAAMTADGISRFDGRSLLALAVVVVAAAIAGIAFSWRRYFGR